LFRLDIKIYKFSAVRRDKVADCRAQNVTLLGSKL
jgi:hypothetical protein